MMAFLTVEDLVGTVEIIVFPKDYERYKKDIIEENKVFVRGRVAMEEEKAPRLICSEIIPFSSLPREIWIRFKNKQEFLENEEKLYAVLKDYDGADETVVFCEEEKALKRLPKSMSTDATEVLLNRLYELFGEKSVKVVEKKLEKREK